MSVPNLQFGGISTLFLFVSMFSGRSPGTSACLFRVEFFSRNVAVGSVPVSTIELPRASIRNQESGLIEGYSKGPGQPVSRYLFWRQSDECSSN